MAVLTSPVKVILREPDTKCLKPASIVAKGRSCNNCRRNRDHPGQKFNFFSLESVSVLNLRVRLVKDKHTQVAVYSMRGEMSSEEAVRGAVQTHSKRVWRFGLALSGAPDIADDLLQATCLRALERHHQVKLQARLDSWLMTICRSIWLNELRARSVRKAQALSITPEAELVAVGPDAETDIFAAEVFTRVMQLPEAQRETVMLVFVEGYSYREAAAMLEVPIGTIMSRLSNARQKLKTMMPLEAADAVRRGGK